MPFVVHTQGMSLVPVCAFDPAAQHVRHPTSISAEGHDHFGAGLVLPEVAILIRLRVGPLTEVEAGQAAGVVVEGAHRLRHALQQGLAGQPCPVQVGAGCCHRVGWQGTPPIQHVV